MERIVNSTGRNLSALAGHRVARVGVTSAALVGLVSAPAFAQGGPIGQLETAATTAATGAAGLVVAVVVILLAIMFGLWAIRKARSG